MPKPLPGELGYSVVARYLSSWSGLDRVGLLTQVYGFRPTASHPACPPAIGRTASMCYGLSAMAAPQFIDNNTLIPYYLAFVDQRAAMTTRTLLSTDNRACISRVLRTAVHDWTRPRTLAACRVCFETDRERYRVAYWHRTHQLPGIAHCLKHGQRLESSNVPYALDKQLRFFTVDSTEVMQSFRVGGPCLFGRNLERQLLSLSTRLMVGSSPLLAGCSPSTYRQQLIQFGFGGRRNELRTTLFEREFIAWLRRNRCDPSALGSRSWWLRLITRIGGPVTPLQHLVLQQFIKEQTRDYLSSQPDMFGFQ